MLQKVWFKLFVWFMSVFFFYLTAGVIISLLRPGPSESDVMKFEQGLMLAMQNSLMSISMSLENEQILVSRIVFFTSLTVPLIIIGAVSGTIIRLRRGGL